MPDHPLPFQYQTAFSRNVGWLTDWEQQVLREKRIAVAGLGGVGGVHLLTLARFGFERFHIADPDTFELVNFNRQAGATLPTLGMPKAWVMAAMARDVNPQADIAVFEEGVNESNLERFLDGVDLFIDGFDFFALDIRAKLFAHCAERGIPAITAAPLGMGVAYLLFLPGGMTFEDYFRLDGLPELRKYVNFALGLAPKGYHRRYLIDPSRLDLASRRGPSTVAACQLCAGVAAVEAVKILLRRGPRRPAPWYHHFDPYLGRWTSRRLWLGNRSPLQTIKLHAAYRLAKRLTHGAFPEPEAPTRTGIERILELARWAPSGDNTQPWRFEIKGKDRLTIEIRTRPETDIYDYNRGQPTLLSAGFLLESLKIAASEQGLACSWSYLGAEGDAHRIDVRFTADDRLRPDPLLAYLPIRSVDRRPYRAHRLSEHEKEALSTCLGPGLRLRWHDGLAARWRIARINARATDIRLRSPAAFETHRRVIDWDSRFSPDRIPGAALGLDALTLRLTRWLMTSWQRMRMLKYMPGGTLLARIEMDLLPGLFCGAHFTIEWEDAGSGPVAGDGTASEIVRLLETGAALQRLWLTATRLGLALQPSLAPLCFAHHARKGALMKEGAAQQRRGRRLVAALSKQFAATPEHWLFLGRIGRPRKPSRTSRSLRRPIAELKKLPAAAATTSFPDKRRQQ